MPCGECNNHQGCIIDTMAYKESGNMEYDETGVVHVDDKSELLKCAKDYSNSDCGYKSAATVCG